VRENFWKVEVSMTITSAEAAQALAEQQGHVVEKVVTFGHWFPDDTHSDCYCVHLVGQVYGLIIRHGTDVAYPNTIFWRLFDFAEEDGSHR
jgi:hypothetical protein